jgi:hypothetical protein
VSQIRIFGREPALVMGAIGAVLAWIATLGFEWMNAGQSTALITFLSALVIAATTRPWSEEAVTGLGTIVLAVCALFGIRSQVTPAADPAPISPATGNVR